MHADTHIHLGLSAQAIAGLRTLTDTPDRIIVDGDGWEVWGEALDVDDNVRNPGVYHVIVNEDHENVDYAIDVLEKFNRARRPDGLRHMNTLHQFGTLLVVTPAEDWSVKVFAVTAGQVGWKTLYNKEVSF